MRAKVFIIAAMAIVLALPFLVRALAGTSGTPASSKSDSGTPKLVIVTPHVEQIRDEFARAFEHWHLKSYSTRCTLDFRTPGGTSDIIKQLGATFDAAARKGFISASGEAAPGSIGFDLFFGGGSYEHGKMKVDRSAKTPPGTTITYRMGRPAGFTQQQLDEIFGENVIGTQNLYDPSQYWIGTALSGFGIVYNREMLKSMGLNEPTSFSDLCDIRYFNLLALADGRQSGSVTTTYESILNKEGWAPGWKILRELCANARYFASSSTKPPIDVGQGEAAAGLAIDFYGRGQAQFLLRPGQDPATGRVGYIDPKGSTYIDADPVTIINGCSDFTLAKRFVEFCLTDEAQSLWQFHPLDSPTGAANPRGADNLPMGPAHEQLRRMPVRRSMYAKYAQHFVDATDPFTAASKVPQRGWRNSIAPLMACFGIDTSPDLRAAWKALNAARQANAQSSAGLSSKRLEQMESLFYAMPTHTFRAGSLYSYSEILDGVSKPAKDELRKNKIMTFASLDAYLKGPKPPPSLTPEIRSILQTVLARRAEFEAKAPATAELTEATFSRISADTDAWNDPEHGKLSLIAYTQFFREKYRRVVSLARETDQ